VNKGIYPVGRKIPTKPELLMMLQEIIWEGLNKKLNESFERPGPKELTVIGNNDTILIKMDGKKFFLNVYEENAPGAPDISDPEKVDKKKK